MSEKDAGKACLSGCSFFASFLLAPAAVVVFGFYTGELRKGLLAGFIVLCVLLIVSATLMSTIREPSAFLTWAPFGAAMVYTAFPDVVPLQIDDAAATAAGAIATFALWLRRQPDLPRTVVLPLLFGALYTLVGAAIPLPVDELFVNGIAVASSLALAKNAKSRPLPPPSPPVLGSAEDDNLL